MEDGAPVEMRVDQEAGAGVGSQRRGEELSFAFEDLSCKIKIKKGLFAKWRKDGIKERYLLNKVSGEFKSGTLTAIIGPSGSGKTTLLNSLAGRMSSGKMTGRLTLNGKEFSRKTWRELSAYVIQDDIMLEELTAKEILDFSAQLRLPADISKKEKKQRVEQVLKDLELTTCANTRVGTPGLKRGLSGGERKRVSIGMELITDPSIIMLDEPTTGLDSYMARSVVLQLQHLAHSLGKMVICTIHQPSSETFRLFDNVMILSKGEIVYHGPNSEAVGYFASLGYQCPADSNPAEYFLDLVQPGMQVRRRDSEEDIEKGTTNDLLESAKDDRIAYLISSWQRKNSKTLSDGSASSDQPTTPPPLKKARSLFSRNTKSSSDLFAEKKKSSRNNLLVEIMILTYRSWLSYIRNKLRIQTRFIESTTVALLCGLCYLRPLGFSQESIQDRQGLLFFALTSNVMPAMASVITYPKEKAVFLREHTSGAYRALSYYLAKKLSELPSQLFFPVLFALITYFMTGLKETAGAFFIYLLVIQLMSQAALSLSLSLGIGFQDAQVATMVAPMTVIPYMLFGGFFLNSESTPDYFLPLQKTSPFLYGFQALVHNEFDGLKFNCPKNSTGQPCFLRNGDDVIESLGFEDTSMAVSIIILGSLGLGFFLLAYIVLELSVRRKK